MTWQERYLARFYDRTRGWMDGTEEFFRLCSTHIRPGGRICEIGAGPSNPTSRFLASLGEVHGVDPDPDVATNDALSSSAVLKGPELPFPGASFTACVSNYVLEHVTDPESHLREVWRVLKPGGVYVFRTPNKWHYVALAARMTPHSIHELVANRLRNLPPDAHDPYPTVYRMNSRRDVRRLASRTQFRVAVLRLVEKEPSYGMSSRALFLLFLCWERTVNSTRLLGDLRANIFAVLSKPDGDDRGVP